MLLGRLLGRLLAMLLGRLLRQLFVVRAGVTVVRDGVSTGVTRVQEKPRSVWKWAGREQGGKVTPKRQRDGCKPS